MPKLCHKSIDKVGKICSLRKVLTNPGKYAIYAMDMAQSGALWGVVGNAQLHVYLIMY
jgi:hypothetical protein